jgi:hypothetical protein
MWIARWTGFLAAAALEGCGGQAQPDHPQATDAATSRVNDGDVVEAAALDGLDSASDGSVDETDGAPDADGSIVPDGSPDVVAPPEGSADSGSGGDDAAADSFSTDSGEDAHPSDGSPPMEDAAACDNEVGPFYCIMDCFTLGSSIALSSCSDGLQTCPSGYVPESDCPADACGVASGTCCDSITGIQYDHACNDAGFAQACPEGTRPAWEYDCIPDALGTNDCDTVSDQECTGPAVSCWSQFGPETHCTCSAQDGGSGLWICVAWIGG